MKSGHNISADKGFTRTNFRRAWLHNHISKVEISKKCTNLNRYISIRTDIDEKIYFGLNTLLKTF